MEAPAQFVTTHWSLVVAASGPLTEERRAALDALCRAYWYPLYAFVRRNGQDPEDAKDLTQSFMAHILERGLFGVADRERGRFRTFLLAALKNFLLDQNRRRAALKRGGGLIIEPWLGEADEDRYQLEPVDAASPDVLYDRGWAKALLQQALRRLRAEYSSSKHAAGFDLLKDYVWGERNGCSCAEVGHELGIGEEAAKKAIQRLRQRFGQLLRELVAETVNTPADLEEELRYLSRLVRE